MKQLVCVLFCYQPAIYFNTRAIGTAPHRCALCGGPVHFDRLISFFLERIVDRKPLRSVTVHGTEMRHSCVQLIFSTD